MNIEIAEQSVKEIIVERKSQDRMWGIQNHDPFEWLAILQEEIGEYSEVALRLWTMPDEGASFRKADIEKLHDECVQVAAVAMAMVECINRNEWSFGRKYNKHMHSDSA